MTQRNKANMFVLPLNMIQRKYKNFFYEFTVIYKPCLCTFSHHTDCLTIAEINRHKRRSLRQHLRQQCLAGSLNNVSQVLNF